MRFPGVADGYAPRMSAHDEQDAPTPPGGPQRQDSADTAGAPAEGLAPGDEGVGRAAEDSVEDAHGGTLDVDDEQPHDSPAGETVGEEQGDRPTQDAGSEARQEHNAETTEDQPSQ